MRIVFSLLLVCLLSAGCAYTPDGEPNIVFNITGWGVYPHPVTPYVGRIIVYYKCKNIGSSDNTKLKKGYHWDVSIPYEIYTTNSQIIKTDLHNNRLIFITSVPNIGEETIYNKEFYLTDIFISNYLQDTNLYFIQNIKSKTPIIVLTKQPFL